MLFEIGSLFDMGELLKVTLDETGKFVLDTHYVLAAVLAVGIVAILFTSRSTVRFFIATLMVAVWVFFVAWMLLDLIETFAFERIYGDFLIMFPAVMSPSLVLSAIGLALHRVIRKRDARRRATLDNGDC